MLDVVRTEAEARDLEFPPVVVLEPLEALLDELGLGAGPLRAQPVGNGHSNITVLLVRDGARLVLRRPPRPPFAESAHDVLREARLMGLARASGLPVPRILAAVADRNALGVPFVLSEHVDGIAIDTALPAALCDPQVTRAVGAQLVDALADVHRVDVSVDPWATAGPPSGYLERQLRRFDRIWQEVATRPVPEIDRVGAWLREHRPAQAETTLVHGDFRLGNLLFAAEPPARLLAILDWEMATLGDPLADLGYLCATWAQPGDALDPMLELSAATCAAGFPSRQELSDRYVGRTGRDISNLGWYEVLARWKCAVFLEASYRRFLSGAASDPYFARLEVGVPQLAEAALARIEELSPA